MKRIKRIIIPILVLIIAAVFLIYLRYSYGTKINHYKQCLIPARGQIATNAHEDTIIRLFFLDEENLSEMASSENIIGIKFYTEDNQTFEGVEWSCGTYSQLSYGEIKELTIHASFSNTCVLSHVTINYIDMDETYDLGELKITCAENVINNWVFSYSDLCKTGMQEYNLITNDTEYVIPDYNLLMMDVTSVIPDFRLDRIDFGIDDIGIEPSSFKQVEEGFDLGESFNENPENSIYLNGVVVKQLPKQELGYELNFDESSQEQFFIFAIRKLSERSDPYCLYQNPIYFCTVEDEQCSFYDQEYLVILPEYGNASFIERMLEANGV